MNPGPRESPTTRKLLAALFTGDIVHLSCYLSSQPTRAYAQQPLSLPQRLQCDTGWLKGGPNKATKLD
jgi:hypothetical protein